MTRRSPRSVATTRFERGRSLLRKLCIGLCVVGSALTLASATLLPTAPAAAVRDVGHSTTVAPAGSSGAAMPVGDLPGWQQTFTEDFLAPVARGNFPGIYADKWTSYHGFPNTSGHGDYERDIISVQGGNLDLYLHAENGRPKVAAPIPLVNGNWGGQTYGRFSVRMRADDVDGYGVAFLLWSDANDWNDGEIDFPEGLLGQRARGFNHCPGKPSVNCLVVESKAALTDWHTYTIEWAPNRLSYLVDGRPVGSTTAHIPKKPLHWVMQVESPERAAAIKSSGHLQIDWATVYRKL